MPTDDENATRFAARIEREVTAALADETTTDWYSARQRAHATDSPELTGQPLVPGDEHGRWVTEADEPVDAASAGPRSSEPNRIGLRRPCERSRRPRLLASAWGRT